MRLLFRGQVFEAELAALAARRGFDFVAAPDTDAALRELPHADAFWVTPTMYSPAFPAAIAAGRGALRWIGLTSAGYDAIIAHGKAPGVVTTFASGVYGPIVAEHALALLLSAVRRLPLALERHREHVWDRGFAAQLRSIGDLTVAIVGFGSIGRHLASALRPFGARIIGVNRTGSADPLADAMFATRDLDAVLAQSDAVVLAVTLDDTTRGLMGARAFAAMRPQTILINVARGAVVDAAALRDAIAAGTIAGACLDVTDPEPLPADDPLWDAPGVLVTPHAAGFGSRATGGRLVAHMERNLDHLIRGEALEGVVP